MNEFWNNTFYGNSWLDWAIAIGIILIGWALLKLFKYFLLNRMRKWTEKTTTSFDDFIVTLTEESVVPFLYVLCVYGGIQWLEVVPKPHVLEVAMLLVTTFYILKSISSALQYFVLSFLKTQEDGETKQKQARGIIIILKAVVWSLGTVFLLDNLGYNISTIIAGLGIGGIAIALAAQTILGDLFSYFVILFDRPFEIDDFIVVDDKSGVVEYIGIKTTRLRTLSGEQLICSNKNLTDSRVHNFKRMEKRRVIFPIGVTYQTPASTLEAIPGIVKDIICSKENIIYDRGHLAGFGDFSINFEFVYFIESSDYVLYMDRKQQVNLEVFKAFEDRGIEFAYPTQTVIVSKEGA